MSSRAFITVALIVMLLLLGFLLWVEKRESGVVLQLNSSSVGGGVGKGRWWGWRWKVVAAQWWWWWKRRLCRDFPTILLRFIIMLRSVNIFALVMPFFNMRKIACIKLHTFLAFIGVFCSILSL
ncbi:hypothetical protein Hanom_Chr07g00582751 [Helianthus anomalus]